MRLLSKTSFVSLAPEVQHIILQHAGVIATTDSTSASLGDLCGLHMVGKECNDLASEIERHAQLLTASRLPSSHALSLASRFPALRCLDLRTCPQMTLTQISHIGNLTHLQEICISVDSLLPDPNILKLCPTKTYERERLIATSYSLDSSSNKDKQEQQIQKDVCISFTARYRPESDPDNEGSQYKLGYMQQLKKRMDKIEEQWRSARPATGPTIQHAFALMLLQRRALSLLQVIADLPNLSCVKLHQTVHKEAALVNTAFMAIATSTVEGIRALGKPELRQLHLMGTAWDARCSVWDRAFPRPYHGVQRQLLLANFLAHVQQLHLALPWSQIHEFFWFFYLNTGRSREPQVDRLPPQALSLQQLSIDVLDGSHIKDYGSTVLDDGAGHFNVRVNPRPFCSITLRNCMQQDQGQSRVETVLMYYVKLAAAVAQLTSKEGISLEGFWFELPSDIDVWGQDEGESEDED